MRSLFISACAGLYYIEMAITEWFKGNIETLDTLLLCVYGWRLAAQHMNLKQMRSERCEQGLVEGRLKVRALTVKLQYFSLHSTPLF